MAFSLFVWGGGNPLKKGMTLLVTINNAKDYKNNHSFVLAFNICISTPCFKKLERILCNEICFVLAKLNLMPTVSTIEHTE